MTSFVPSELIKGVSLYMFLSIGTVDGKLFHYVYYIASPFQIGKTSFLIKIIFRAKIKIRLLVIKVRNKRGAMPKNHTSV